MPLDRLDLDRIEEGLHLALGRLKLLREGLRRRAADYPASVRAVCEERLRQLLRAALALATPKEGG